MISEDDLRKALDAIARTPDGQLLYSYLQKALCSISLDAADGALRQHEGRRRFAAELMAHMAEGIEDSDRSCITFSTGGPRRVASTQRGAGRRVTADTAVPGWDAESGPSTGGTEPA